MKKKLPVLAWLVLACFLLPGCSTTVTNLTPSTQKRAANGLYPFEVALDTRQHSLLHKSVKPSVVVGAQVYPMQPTPMLGNRWEAVVPVPADKEFVNYRYKFDYLTRAVGGSKPGSKLSAPYQLHILDK